MDLAFFWCWGFVVGVAAAPIIGGLLSGALVRMLRPVRCKMGMCPGTVSSSDYGMGWLCRDCGSLKHWESWKRIDNPSRWERLKR